VIPASTGVHTYSVHVLGTEVPADDFDSTFLGRRTVRVGQSGPIGRVERFMQLGDAVRLTGWAYDPDRPTTELAITVFRDGAPLSKHRTGLDWAELSGTDGAELAGTDGALGRPGFDLTVEDAPGPHTYTVYATGADARQVLIGSHAVVAAAEVAV
jgi:hypothetical protein